MFNDPKLKINVNMNGKEYMDYRKSRSLTKNQMDALVILIFILIGIGAIAILVQDISPKPEVKTYAEKMMDNYQMSILTWNQIGKMLVFTFAPWLIIGMVIAWMIHGFGFIIMRR